MKNLTFWHFKPYEKNAGSGWSHVKNIKIYQNILKYQNIKNNSIISDNCLEI